MRLFFILVGKLWLFTARYEECLMIVGFFFKLIKLRLFKNAYMLINIDWSSKKVGLNNMILQMSMLSNVDLPLEYSHVQTCIYAEMHAEQIFTWGVLTKHFSISGLYKNK